MFFGQFGQCSKEFFLLVMSSLRLAHTTVDWVPYDDIRTNAYDGEVSPCPWTAESEKARWRVGIANRKVFARPEIFCAYIQNGPKIKSKHSISL